MRPRALALAAALACGCASPEPARYLAPDFGARAPARVAVLPFDNESVDLAGPELLRRLVFSRLEGHGFAAPGLEAVDAALAASLGITDGGQLRSVEPARLGRALGADGLLYGTVEDFAFVNVGFAVRRVVRLRLRLVEAAGGARLWEDAGLGLTERLTLTKKGARRAFFEGVAERAAEGLLRTPLMPESLEAVRCLFSRLPRGAAAAQAPLAAGATAQALSP